MIDYQLVVNAGYVARRIQADKMLRSARITVFGMPLGGFSKLPNVR